MWVAYVTNVEPTALSHRATLIPTKLTRENHNDAWDQTQIEMVVTVLVDRKSPFTSHSGIFRTWRFWIPKQEAPSEVAAIPFGHKRLSVPLHQFAALMSRKLYSHMKVHNSFMVTKPEDKMGEILSKSGLLAGKDFIAGSGKERREHKEAHYRSYMPPWNQPPVPFITEIGPRDSILGDRRGYARRAGVDATPKSLRSQLSSRAVTYTIRLSALAGLWPQGPRFGAERARHVALVLSPWVERVK
jgi:hypothetical protein